MRTAAVIWLAAWMLAIPLVHVHPEADHHHGDPRHVHGGTVHTVFSRDLPCEYAASAEHPQPRPTWGGPSPHFFDHPEIGLSIASTSVKHTDRPLVVVALASAGDVSGRHVVREPRDPEFPEPAARLLPGAGPSLRAPPPASV